MDNPDISESVDAVRKVLDNAYNIVIQKLSATENEVNALRKKNEQLVSQVEKLKIRELAELKKENFALRTQLKIARGELQSVKASMELMSKRIHKERVRVNGWKKMANRLNNKESVEDILRSFLSTNKFENKNKDALFLSPNGAKNDIDIYTLALMTEQYNDDLIDNEQNDDFEVAIEEAELSQPDDDIDHTDLDGSEAPSSPSILSKSLTKKPLQLSKKHFLSLSSEVVYDCNCNDFDTSNDLFVESSPLLASTAVSLLKASTANRISTPCNIIKPSKDLCVNLGSTKSVVGPVKLDEKPYKYVEVVRKKADREKLNGYMCHECMQYYKSDNLTKEQLEGILKQCSRHRHKSTPPPNTPEDFWSTSFPSTQECIKKGYLGVQKPNGLETVKKTRKRIKYN